MRQTNFRKRLLGSGLVFLFLASMFSFLYLPGRGLATILWSDGFESGNTNAWDVVTGTVYVTSVHVFTGTYSANITSNKTSQSHYVEHDFTAATSMFFSCHYYFDTLALPDESYPQIPRLQIMELESNGPQGIELCVEKRMAGDYVWRVFYIDAYDSMQIDTLQPAAGNWYGIEMSWNHSSGDTGVSVWINGTTIFSDIDPDPYSSHVDIADLGAWGYWGANAYTFKSFFDDGVLGDAYLGCPGVGAPGADTTPPEFLDGNPYLETNTLDWNTSLAGELCSVSVNATDNVGLSGFYLNYTTDLNHTTWTQTTWQSTSGTNKKITANFSIPIPTAENWTIWANFYANDTANNWGVSLSLWPATYLTIGPLMNSTSVNGYVSGIAISNKAGTRRIFHSTHYWVAFYYYLNKIWCSTSPDGVTWASQGIVNSDPSGDSLPNDDESAWGAFAWGTDLYVAYANGTYSASANDSQAFYRHGVLSSTGTVTWYSRANLILIFKNLISASWPGPGGNNYIYGYYGFSFTLSKDATRLWLGFRVTGGFSSDNSRIFLGWIASYGGMTAVTQITAGSYSYYDTEQFSVVTDPSHNIGFLLLYRSHDNGYIYYARWNGLAWQKVKYPAQNNYICPLVSTTDWSTAYVPFLNRSYFSGKDVGTYYFPDVSGDTGEFVGGGPTTSYTQINIGHTDQDLHIVCTDGNLLYVYTKNGPTPPGWIEGATWTSATVRGKALQGFTALSCTEDAGIYQKIGLLWGNYTSSYDVLFGEWGSPRFTVTLDVDLEGCGNWVFANDRFYNFNLSIWYGGANASSINLVLMRFSQLTKNGLIACTFMYAAGNFSVSFSPSNTTSFPTRIAQTTVTFSSAWDYAYVNFKIYFTSEALDIWNPLACVDVETYVSDTEGYSTGWQLIGPNFFRVYAQGGFILDSTVTGTAGILATGTPFSFYAENDSYVYRDLVYRDLVHVKMLPQISGIIGKQTFYVSFGVDYCLKTYDWVEGWKVIMGAVSVTTGSTIYFNWSISWWNRGAFVRQEYIRAFAHTNVPRGWYDPNENYTVTTGMWIDLWFDRQNASMVGGGRVNAYEFGMTDSVEPWLALLTSDWGPIENQTKQSMQMFPILDGDNVTEIPASQIKMVKVWSSLEVAPAETEQEVVVSDYPVFDLTFSQPFPPLTGIQTPVFDETTYPDMPSGGIIGALFSGMSSWFKWLGENILYGGLNLWGTFVGFLDTIAGFIGFPGFFTWLVGMLSQGWSWMVSSFTYIGQMLLQFFLFLASIMGYVVALLTIAVTNIANVISTVASMFSGAYGTGANIWNDFGLTTWLTLACICYPIYLVILWDEEGFDALSNHLMFVFNILNMLFHFFISIIQLVLSGVHTLIEAIPVVE